MNQHRMSSSEIVSQRKLRHGVAMIAMCKRSLQHISILFEPSNPVILVAYSFRMILSTKMLMSWPIRRDGEIEKSRLVVEVVDFLFLAYEPTLFSHFIAAFIHNLIFNEIVLTSSCLFSLR